MALDGLEITRHGHQGKGHYRAHIPDSEKVGRLTWVQRGDIRVAEHTIVPPELGGQGIAFRLVEELLADAREQNFRIDPQCSYVAAQFAKHPEWADLRS